MWQVAEWIDRVLAEDPWLVVVELGGNDILRRVPIETTESALNDIVERLLEAGTDRGAEPCAGGDSLAHWDALQRSPGPRAAGHRRGEGTGSHPPRQGR